MTVLDERGEPVVVEYIGPGRYLASGWWGGVGRYADLREVLRPGWGGEHPDAHDEGRVYQAGLTMSHVRILLKTFWYVRRRPETQT